MAAHPAGKPDGCRARAFNDAIRSVDRRPLLRALITALKREGLQSISRVAVRHGKSLTTVRHLFKDEMGVSMRRYLLQRRIRLAAHLLVRTKMPIKFIQFRCRFRDAAVFAHCFKSRFGVPPSEYRKMFALERPFGR